MKAAYLCLFALLAAICSARSPISMPECVQDYECGNLPYAMCKGGVNDCKNTLKGLGINEQTGEVYYGQICKARNMKLSNVTIKSASTNGGTPTSRWSALQTKDASNIAELYDVVGNNLYYSTTQEKSTGKVLYTVALPAMSDSKVVDTTGNFQGALDFDVSDKKTYVCNLDISGNTMTYTIDRFSGILGQEAASKTTLFTLAANEACTGVRKSSTGVFYTTKNVGKNADAASTKVYRDNTVLFTVAKFITEFDVTADRIYYTTPSGVYLSDLNGANVQQISTANGASGISAYQSKVYFNTGMSIVSTNLDGSDIMQINQHSGKCTCKPGFSGPKCDRCPSGQIQWLEGSPSCITLTSEGNPTTCNYDYECATSPYAYCDGLSCKCRKGFSGNQCNKCSGSIQWQDGVPSCN